MKLTQQNILHQGTLLVKDDATDSYERVLIYQHFRFFFSLRETQYSPADLSDSDQDGVPDYVIHLLHKVVVAYAILVDGLGFQDLFAGLWLDAQKVHFLDIYLQDIAVEHGIASASIYDFNPEVVQGSLYVGNSLRLIFHRNLHAGTATPIHELVHLFQFSYVPFNNIWFMEGVARWGQRFMQTNPGKTEPLPATQEQLEALLKKWHDAEHFWNRLVELSSPNSVLEVPESLRDCGVPIQANWSDGRFMRFFLERCTKNVALLSTEQRTRDLPSYGQWNREEKRSANNNKYILKSILEALVLCQAPAHPELDAFIDLVTPLIRINTDNFADPAVQKFMCVLQKYALGKVTVSPKAVLYSDYFDLATGTLSIQTVDFSGLKLSNAELDTFKVVRHLIGSLKFEDNPDLTSLAGLENLQAIEGSLTINATGIRHLNGLTLLERVKGHIEIQKNSQLRSINGFTALEVIDTQVTLANNEALTIINGFNSLRQIKKGALTIENCPQLININGFNSLAQVKHLLLNRLGITQANFLSHLIRQQPEFKGHIKITSCRLQNLDCFTPLTGVNSFYLFDNKLKNLRGLENLRHVEASFSLSTNQLNDISQLARLESVDGMLALAHNQLSSLHGLEQLRQLKTVSWNGQNRTLVLNDNPHLQDIAALANLQTQDNYLIILADDYRQYQHKPDSQADFHKNIIEWHDLTAKRIIPSYRFVNKPVHDYANFRKTTHNRLLKYLLDFETPADTLILSFTGFNGNLGGVFYNRFPWIVDGINTHKIFMNDTQNIWYHKGIPPITKSMNETIELIRQLMDQYSYRKILCIGTSMGGYMSLLIGYLLEATDVIAFAPQIFLDPANRSHYGDTRWTGALKSMPTQVNPKYLDLGLLYQDRSNLKTQIQIHYGRHLELDHQHIEHLGEYPNVQLFPYDVEDHYIPKYLDNLGLLHSIIADTIR